MELIHTTISLLEEGAGHISRVLLHHLQLLSLQNRYRSWRRPMHVRVHFLIMGELRTTVQTVRPALHLRLIPADTRNT